MKIQKLFPLFLITFLIASPARSAPPEASAPAAWAAAVSVKSHGAKGDGVTDDTAAIQAAVAKAGDDLNTVFFPPGEYLISQGIYLHANLTVTGAPGAVLKKVPAVTQHFSQPVPQGGKSVVVENASAFRVGQDCYLWDGVASGYTGTVGRITAVDSGRNIVTFEGIKSDGAKRAYAVTTNGVFSTSFSMLTSNASGKPIENLVIEGLTFDCQKQPGEPESYPLAPIHIDPRPAGNLQQNVVIRNNVILNSASDGISVQGCDNTTIENNRVLNCGGQGIHVGFTITRVTIRNNHVEGCGASGIFWCYGVTHTIVTNNFIKDCAAGCGGIGDGDLQSVIAFNSFDGNAVGIDMSANVNGRTVITDNLFRNGKGTDISAYVSSFCTISNNVFSGGKQVGISLRGVDRARVVNNQFHDYEGEFAIRLWRQPGGPKRPSQRIGISGNIIVGGKVAAIYAEDSNQITISDNQITPADGAKAIEVSTSCSDVTLRDNLVEGEVNNQAISKL